MAQHQKDTKDISYTEHCKLFERSYIDLENLSRSSKTPYMTATIDQYMQFNLFKPIQSTNDYLDELVGFTWIPIKCLLMSVINMLAAITLMLVGIVLTPCMMFGTDPYTVQSTFLVALECSLNALLYIGLSVACAVGSVSSVITRPFCSINTESTPPVNPPVNPSF